MGFLEPAGYVECDMCGDTHVMEMVQLADGTGGFDCWGYVDAHLPAGWAMVHDAPYCAACKKEEENGYVPMALQSFMLYYVCHGKTYLCGSLNRRASC